MKNPVFVAFVVVILLLFIGAHHQSRSLLNQTLEKRGTVKKIEFKELLSIGSDDFSNSDYLLGGITDLYIDFNNIIYVLDMKNYRVSRFSEDGDFLNYIGKGKGQGPGEFTSPSKLCVDENELVYISDPKSRKIQVFDVSGHYIDQIKLLKSWPQYDIDVFQGNLFIGVDTRAYHSNVWKKGIFQIFSTTKNKIISSIGNSWEKKDSLRHIGSNKIFINKNMNFCIISYSHPYLLEVYSHSWKLKKQFSRKTNFFDELVDNGLGTFVYNGGSRDVTCLGDKYILNLIVHRIQKNKKEKPVLKQIIDFYDMTGNLLNTINVEDYRCFEGKYIVNFAPDQKGNLWIGFDEPFPHVTKYLVEFTTNPEH